MCAGLLKVTPWRSGRLTEPDIDKLRPNGNLALSTATPSPRRLRMPESELSCSKQPVRKSSADDAGLEILARICEDDAGCHRLTTFSEDVCPKRLAATSPCAPNKVSEKSDAMHNKLT